MEPSLSELDNLQNTQLQNEPSEAEKQAAADKATADAAKQAEEADAERLQKEEADRLAKEEADKLAAGNVADKDKPEGGEENEGQDDDPTQFYAEVNKFHGFDEDPIKVDYGNVDPLSPEGIYLRDKAVIEYSQQEYQASLQKSFPRAYEYFLHSKAGKSDEEFFGKPDVSLPDYDALKENIDLQKKLVVEDLRSRGLNEKSIGREVEALIKEGELQSESDKVFKQRQQAQVDAIEALKKVDIERQQEEQRAISGFDTLVDNVIIKGNTTKLQIPDAKRADFANSFKEQVFFDSKSNKFLIVKELNDKNITDIVEQEYFGFVKGNLKDLVLKEAKTQNAIRLRSSVQRSKDVPGGSRTTTVGNKPLGEL